MNAAEVKAAVDDRFARVLSGPPIYMAPNGTPFVTVTSGGEPETHGAIPPRPASRPTEADALRALLSELNIWLAGQTGDTLYWRVTPQAGHDGDGWSARCRLAVGNQADEGVWTTADGVVVEKEPASATVHQFPAQTAGTGSAQAQADNQTGPAELPTWRSHKVVRAAKIVRVVGTGPLSLSLVLDTGQEVPITDKLLQRLPPGGDAETVGGYYVRYEDGYESWSPAKAFEEGYRPVDLAMEQQDPISAAVVACETVIRLEFERAVTTPYDRQIVAVCKELCRQQGLDPDMIVMGGPGYNLAQAPNGAVAIRHPLRPVWATFVAQVKPVLDVIEQQRDH